jgi:hypothetical protein
MNKLLLLSLAAIAVYAGDDTCPAYSDWLPWSNDCLWLPFDDMRDKAIAACDITVPDNMLKPIPSFGEMPDKCGHCSFKFRCRKRSPDGDCFPLNAEREVCHEHSDVCEMPKIPMAGLDCKYDVAGQIFMQCGNRPDVADWMRHGFREYAKVLPQFHCKKSGDKCSCCCHPYAPSEDGTTCVEHSEPKCESWGDWNDWSEKCLWFPPKQMRLDWQEHTGMEIPISKKAMKVYDKFNKMPDGSDFPDRCGMCSFKFKARKRSEMSEEGKKDCFPLDVMKKPCGNEDVPNAGDICTLPKMLGSCNYTQHMRKLFGTKGKEKLKKMPMTKRMDFVKVLTNFPHGKCIEKDGQCKCCCHPYEPNAEGTECVVAKFCDFPTDWPSQIDYNLADDALWFL